MASLTGTKIKDTYDALLKVSDNGALDGTLQTITDGLGNNSALSLSTAGASVGGTLAVSGAATLSSTLGVTGAATLSGGVSGNTTFSGDLTIGSVSVGKNINTFSSSYGSNGVHSFYGTDNNLKLQIGGLSNDLSFLYSPSGVAMAFFAGATERMRIHSGGDISFRDSSANEAFYWDASAASLGIGGAPNVVSNYSLITTKGTNGSGIWSNVGGTLAGLFYSSADFTFVSEQRALPIIFETSGIERMRIDSSGNVGIGASDITSVGAYKVLELNGAGGSGGYLRLGSSDTEQGYIASSAGGLFYDASAGGSQSFYVSGSEKMRILPTGGITFNGDTSSANALDDYEEGTWTPTLLSGTCTGTAYYTKIGRLVNVFGTITHATDGAGSVGVTITNLPIASTQISVGHSTFTSGSLDALDTQANAITGSGATANRILFGGSPSGSGADASRWLSGATFTFNITYIS